MIFTVQIKFKLKGSHGGAWIPLSRNTETTESSLRERLKVELHLNGSLSQEIWTERNHHANGEDSLKRAEVCTNKVNIKMYNYIVLMHRTKYLKLNI